jgi:glucose-1-phosphate thymidylyltransferase
MKKKYKGIILAGGKNTRLFPTTKYINKHLLNVYDKPMIYYALSVLFLAKIKDILIITNKKDINLFQQLLGDGKKYGANITFMTQKKPEGIAQAIHIGARFISNNKIALLLGDNIFFGSNFRQKLDNAMHNNTGATIFTYPVANPKQFGIVEYSKNKIKKIVEKPMKLRSNIAVTGLYFYDNSAIKYSKSLKKSKRGEFEITDLNQIYIKRKKLKAVDLDRGFYWNDAGTFDNLLDSSNTIRVFQKKHACIIGDPREIAKKNKWI